MIFYDFLLFFYFLILSPKLFWERLKGKRHPNLLQRLGWVNPIQTTKQVVWFHAVSLGEMKAAKALIQRCKKEDVFLVITTTTTTGYQEAIKSGGDRVYYLPLDFHFSVNRFVHRIKPQLLILIESDIWPNLLKAVKNHGAKIVLANGKMSKRSFQRWSFFSSISQNIFNQFDLICAQTEDYAALFRRLIQNHKMIHVTGNLKFDAESKSIQRTSSDTIYITLSCTHAPEEMLLLTLLKKEPYFFFLAPRHPERFPEVARLLEKETTSFIRLSSFSKRKGDERVILVDTMGDLPFCYSKSKLAIVCGSFVSHVGGHNIFEPCLYECPVLFGPHMFSQKELVQKVLEENAGLQMSLENLKEGIETILKNHSQFLQKTKSLVLKTRGSTEATFQKIQQFLKKN